MRGLTATYSEHGAIVGAAVGLSNQQRSELLRLGRPVPPPARLRLLVDTGASHSLVPEATLQAMGIAVIDVVRMASATTGDDSTETCCIYPVHLVIGDPATANVLRFDALPISARPFARKGYEGLLGRDVLQRLQMSWVGPTGRVELMYP